MKKLSSVLWFLFALAISALAVERPFLGKEAKGWKEVEALTPMGTKPPFPTIRYVPTDSRNASVLITVIGKGKITDLNGLRPFLEMVCQPFLSTPKQKIEAKSVALPHAQGLWTTFEDPDLIGKAPIRGNYKFTTPVVFLFEGGVLAHATIFADERAGRTLDEAMAMIKSVELKADVAKNPAPNRPQSNAAVLSISRPGLDAVLELPGHGLTQIPGANAHGESYFCYLRDDGSEISGWLEPVSNYPGFKSLWTTDKKKMEEGMRVKVREEKFEVIGGWQVVTYVIQLSPGLEQWNLRACRTWGHTWSDVHLSSVDSASKADPLREFLKKVTLRAAEPVKSSDPSRL